MPHHLTFTTFLPISLSSPPTLALSRRSPLTPAPTLPRPQPRASLTADLVLKVLEVSVATAATHSLSQATPTPTPASTSSPPRAFFKRQPAPPSPPPAPKTTIGALVAALLSQDTSASAISALPGVVGDLVGTLAHTARASTASRLAICVLIDLLGSGSLAIPFVGDLLDVATAPVSALLIHAIFRDARVTGVVLAEELLPGSDLLPSATLAALAHEAGWLRENGLPVDDRVRKVAKEVAGKGMESVQEGLRVGGVVAAEKESFKGMGGRKKGGKKKDGKRAGGFWR